MTTTETASTSVRPSVTSEASAAKKYRERDAHEAFFRPTAVRSQQHKKAKKKGLTDKQRVKEAHTHWIIHHDKAQDATRFLSQEANTSNVSAETIGKLTLMTTNPFEQPATSCQTAPPAELTWVTPPEELTWVTAAGEVMHR